MRVCFVGPANNYHIHKWCMYFVDKGHEVHVISFINDEINGVIVHWVDSKTESNGSDMKKIRYLLKAKEVAKLIKQIKPDIVNAHYATSYGMVTALSGVKNYYLSVWGSDIYDFPNKSIFHRIMLRYSLSMATTILSTSEVMAKETSKYTSKKILITPFGVDMKLFNPCKKTRIKEDDRFIVGTVKSLKPVYGIDYLLKAVKKVKEIDSSIPIKVRIAGAGEYEKEYKGLGKALGIEDDVTWLGFISQEQAASEWANMDLAIVYSNKESFGVSAVEAQACGVPLIISNAPGLLEVTKPGKTSVVVPMRDELALAKQIVELYYDAVYREEISVTGRRFVQEKYEYEKCFNKIENIFINGLSM